MTVSLRASGESSYITNDPPTDPDSAWSQHDAHIMTLLWNSLEPDIFNNVACQETSKAVWDTLRELYSSDQNISRVFQIYQNIFSLQQGDRSVDEYFSILKAASLYRFKGSAEVQRRIQNLQISVWIKFRPCSS